MGKNQESIWGHCMILGAILIYSFNTNFMKILIPNQIEAEGLVFLRCIVSAVVFGIIGFFIKVPDEKKPQKKEIGMMLLGGVIGIAGNLYFYIKGLSLTEPSNAFVIRTVQPLIIASLAVLFLHKKITIFKLIGIFLGIAGTVYLALYSHAGNDKFSILGDGFVFLSVICNAVFLILIQPYTKKFNSLIVMKWMSISAMIVTIPIGINQLIHAPIFIGNGTIYGWLELGYTLLFSTVIGYFLTIKALQYISPFIESVYYNILPITGTFVAVLFGLQTLSKHYPIALALIIGGFVIINIKGHNKKTKKIT